MFLLILLLFKEIKKCERNSSPKVFTIKKKKTIKNKILIFHIYCVFTSYFRARTMHLIIIILTIYYIYNNNITVIFHLIFLKYLVKLLLLKIMEGGDQHWTILLCVTRRRQCNPFWNSFCLTIDFFFFFCHSEDKLEQQHSLFNHYKDPCRLGPGEDKPWALGEFSKKA